MIGRVNVAGRGEGPAPGPAYSIEKWCKVVGLTYSDISDISEQNMRILMSKHASVDYFMEWYTADNAMFDDFTQSVIAMKWIGLNDYITDKLLAISDAESRLLASPYWEYILKDHVPIMTANDAPYGETSASSVFNSYLPYIAFDGTTNSWLSTYRSTSLSTPIWIKYKFTNPICIKKSRYKLNTNVNTTSVSILFEVSNDDVNWTPLGTSTDFNSADFSNDSYFLYIRTTIQSGTSAVSAYWGFESLQFYGRSLTVSETSAPTEKPYLKVGSVYYTVDYSDRTEREYIYDHGVELMPIEIVKINAVVEKRNGELYLEYSGGNIAEGFVVRNVDTTRFSIMRAFAGDKKVNNNFLCVVEHATSGMGADVAYAAISEGLPFNVYLDMSSCNQNYDIGVYNKSGYTITKIDTITEWWLE